MAAASSATVASSAYYVPARKRVSLEDRRVRTMLPSIPRNSRRRQRLLVIRSSGEESTTTAVDEEEPQTPAEVPKGPPSLISALNVERALRGLAITDADHYGRLGLRAGCPYNEVDVAYKRKVTELTEKGLEEEEASKELELLKESYSILSSVEERRLYDWSLARSGNPDNYKWPFEVDITQADTMQGDPPPREPEDEWPTTLLGYFFLGWLLLSFVLFIVLNR